MVKQRHRPRKGGPLPSCLLSPESAAGPPRWLHVLTTHIETERSTKATPADEPMMKGVLQPVVELLRHLWQTVRLVITPSAAVKSVHFIFHLQFINAALTLSPEIFMFVSRAVRDKGKSLSVFLITAIACFLSALGILIQLMIGNVYTALSCVHVIMRHCYSWSCSTKYLQFQSDASNCSCKNFEPDWLDDKSKVTKSSEPLNVK